MPTVHRAEPSWLRYTGRHMRRRSRDPLDDLKLHAVSTGPRTPWFWIVLALAVAAALLWLLMSRANTPEEGGVRTEPGSVSIPN
jgi:bacteriorhodopsin